MPAMTFRFTTECEITLNGDNYEDIYMQFKDLIHGDQQVIKRSETTIYPPESVQVFYHTDQEQEYHEITAFKGDFLRDIGAQASGLPAGSAESRRVDWTKIQGWGQFDCGLSSLSML